MTGRKCITHGQWQVCERDIVAIILPTYKMQVGVVKNIQKTVVALSASCKNTKPTKYINLQHALEVYVLGSCK